MVSLSFTSLEEKKQASERMVYGFIFFDFIVAQIVGLVIIITGIIDCFINLKSRTTSENKSLNSGSYIINN